MKIGIFDSGVGGLTVVRELFKELPQASVIYFGDTARAPYGNKSRELIQKYSAENVDFLLSRGAELIIIGCNTASALAADFLREKYPNTPIFDVITPAVEQAVKLTKNKKIGVIGTRGTIVSGAYEEKITASLPGAEVFSKACPLLVSLVEEGWLDQPETKMIARKYLTPLRQRGLDTLILGCTHYPLLKPIISAKIGARVNLVDSAEEVVKEITNYELPARNTTHNVAGGRITNGGGKSRFYFSDQTPQVKSIAERWLGRAVEIIKV